MKHSLFGNLLGITLVVGAVITVIKIIEWLDSQGDDYELSSFDDMVKKQRTVDELNAVEITRWIKEVQSVSPKGLTYIIAFPTATTIEKFHLKGFPEDMDTEHNVILLAANKDTFKPVKIQMLSFGTVDESFVSTLFKGEDYAVVEE